MIEETIDETEEIEIGTEIEIAATEEIVETAESVEGLDHHTTARRAVKARLIPIPRVATTEQENEKTDTEAMAEEMTESGTATEETVAHLGETIGGRWRRGLVETETCSMIAEVVEVVVAAAEEIVTLFKVEVEGIVMLSRTERRAPLRLPRKRNQRLI